MIDRNGWTRFEERQDGIGNLHEAIKAGRIDRAKGVISGVRLMGFQSKNDRVYKQPDPALFEGVQVRMDHHGKEGGPELPTDPSFMGIWATTENVKVDHTGVYADVKYNPKHPMMETILWWAEHQPSVGGFSPITWGLHTMENGRTTIEILKVESVDLVDRPATTTSFYERENDTMAITEAEVLKLHESIATKTVEVTGLTAKVAERDATIAALTKERDDNKKRADTAEGTLAAEQTAKKAAERRGLRLKLVSDANLPEDIVTAEFKEAVVNAADDAAATLLVETVKRAHGSPRSSTTDPSAALGGKPGDVTAIPAKALESFAEAKKAGAFSYEKGR